jgi:TRAP-type C4-dicarboxylate transport system substrate-binding protein
VPSDAKGLKFRVQTSDVAVAMIEAMGASAQKLAFKEVYGALQTGVVDGQENTWSNIYTQKFFEVQDGITETNHQVLAYLLVTSTEWLDGLDPEVRDQFLAIVDDVTKEANAQVAEEGSCKPQNIIDAGATMRELTPEQRAEWVAVMKPVWDQVRRRHRQGPDRRRRARRTARDRLKSGPAASPPAVFCPQLALRSLWFGGECMELFWPSVLLVVLIVALFLVERWNPK